MTRSTTSSSPTRRALEANGVESVYMIGDAAAPRMIVDCIFDGHRLAREIDSADPAVPLPFIRERRLWGSTDNASFQAQLLNELRHGSDAGLRAASASIVRDPAPDRPAPARPARARLEQGSRT